jgi:hypothetical protein
VFSGPYRDLLVKHAADDSPELSRCLVRLSLGSRNRLTRSLVRALQGRRRDTRTPLNEAVRNGCLELRFAGMDDQAIKEFFGLLVEDTGRACGADRPSLVSGELRWMPVRARVFALVDASLQVEPAEPLLAMDHTNGPR